MVFFASSSEKAYEITWFLTSSSEKPCECTWFLLMFFCIFINVFKVFYVNLEAVNQADFAHALEALRLHEVAERSKFEGVEILQLLASEISSATLGGSIQRHGSFQWMRQHGSLEGKFEAFHFFVFPLFVPLKPLSFFPLFSCIV